MPVMYTKKVIEDEEMGMEQKIKMKKKRKQDEEESLVDTNVKKKKKKKEEEDKVKDDEDEGRMYTKRRRKDGDTDWNARCEDNAEIIRARAINKSEMTEEGGELVTHKKKKKKKKETKEKREDSEGSETHFKAKKKKRREAEEEAEISQPLSESSFTSSLVKEKRKRDKGGKGREGEENMYSSEDHTFIMPERREKQIGENNKGGKSQRRKKKRGAGKEGRRENTNSHSSQRIGEGGIEMSDGGDREEESTRLTENASHLKKTVEEQERQTENVSYSKKMEEWERLKRRQIEAISQEEERLTESISHSRKMEQERERLKKRLCGGISRLAYSGMLGWETDTSVDDIDYSDDLYHQPRGVLKGRMILERNAAAAEVEGQVIYSEGEEISGFVPSLGCSADGEDEGWVPVEVPSMHRGFPGFILQQRDIPTLEEATYKFPPSAGIAEEELEEVQEYEDYWKIKDMIFQPSRYTEEAKKYIDDKLQYTEDYFERLESGNLTPAELSETRPDNFDDPFYPTPRQLEFLNNLNITVDWPLSELHLHHLTTYTLSSKTYAEWHSMGILVETSRFTLREDKILARNWFAFQKEYGFYDLRPLVSARTGRVLHEFGRVIVQPFEYLSQRNKVHFLLYLGKDLPHRTLNLIYKKARKLLPFLRGRCLMRKAQRVTGLMLAKLQYVMEIFGTDMLAAELLIGPPLSSFFSVCFLNHFMLRNIKLRIGPWKKAEDQRMLQGLKEVLKVQSFEMAYHLRKIPWMQIFPYVRTRNPMYMRRRMNILAGKSGEKYSVSVMRQEMVKFIRLLYSKQVDNFHGLDWEGLAREMDSANPIRLSWSFRKLYFNHIPYKQRITVPEGLQYMYDVFIPYYENLTQANDAEFQGTHHLNPEHTDLGNPDDPDPGNPDDPDPGNPDDPDPGNPDDPDQSIGPGERSVVRNSICGLIPGNCGLDDLSGVDGERQGCITPSRRDGSGDSDLRSRDEVRREQSDLRNSRKVSDSNLSDLSTELNNHNSKKVKDHYPDDPRNRRKVTKQHSNLQNSRRKGRRNHQDDLTRPLRMTQDDLTQLGKPPLQELHDLTCIPPQCDLGTLNVDLSDSDNDLAWGNDGLEFEEVTLGQALGRDAKCLKRSR